jgi:microcystin degradation protein MlrC
MRVGIVGLQHESNTFLSTPTTWEDFQQGAVLAGRALRTEYESSHHEVGGFFECLDDEGIEAVPIFFAWAMPSGTIAAPAVDKLLASMTHELAKVSALDGLLVAPHGAAVSTGRADVDGYWLRELRSRVGPQMPIVGTLDLHANLSPAMVSATDALVAFRTNPHLDQRQRGREAAHLMARILRREVRPTQAAAYPPMAINIERQFTAASPCRECYEAIDDMLADKRVLAISLLLGFPYADVPEMGTSVLVVTNDEPELAQSLANQVSGYLIDRAADFEGRFLSLDEAVAQMRRATPPVCLLDMGDNVGGGSPGDGTILLAALCQAGVRKTLACLYDPQAVEQATRAGIGKRLSLAIGGKTDALHGSPLSGEALVRGLYDGRFSESRPRHGGRVHYDMGQTAVVELNSGPTVILTSRRSAPFSLGQLACCHVDPRDFDAIVVKGVHAPVAAYEPVCPTILRVNTPGVTTADLSQLEYRHRRRPMFPFERA